MTLGPLPFGKRAYVSSGGGFRAAPTVLFGPVGNASSLNLYRWLVRSSDGKCLVVDIEPTDKDKSVTKIGKDVYQSADQAEADSKRLCTEAKPHDKSAP